jgi:hypothetical protein
MKKRTFILLELLIACTLLTLCAVPLMRKPIELYQTQIKILEEFEKQRLADAAFAEIKIHLLTNQIAWEKLPSKTAKVKTRTLAPVSMQIPYCKPKSIKRRALMRCKGEKTGLQGQIIRMLEIEIQFEPFDDQLKKSASSKYLYRAIATQDSV